MVKGKERGLNTGRKEKRLNTGGKERRLNIGRKGEKKTNDLKKK